MYSKDIKIYIDYVNKPLFEGSEKKGGGSILEVNCGAGKTVLSLKMQMVTLLLTTQVVLRYLWAQPYSAVKLLVLYVTIPQLAYLKPTTAWGGTLWHMEQLQISLLVTMVA